MAARSIPVARLMFSAALLCALVMPAAGESLVQFSDDFEDGLDTSVWYREVVNGGQWVHATEGDNGYITALAQSPYNRDNRNTDILSYQSDFSDFLMTWNMRFHTQSWHKDWRPTYFRAVEPPLAVPNWYGYWAQVGVWIPTIPDHYLDISKRTETGGESLTPSYVSYPWELERWYSFKLEVNGNVFKLKVWEEGDPEPEGWTIEAVDPDSTYSSGSIGFGNYWGASTDVDNVTVIALNAVEIDVRPFSAENRINPNSPIPFPVAILGSELVDVRDVDVTTLAFGPDGAAPALDLTNPLIYWLALKDVNEDGETDLLATFFYSETGLPLGESEACLTGEIDGIPFEGCDTVLVALPPGCGLSAELALLLPPILWFWRRRSLG